MIHALVHLIVDILGLILLMFTLFIFIAISVSLFQSFKKLIKKG
jgi:hypothetical protein